jgi:hypothetical protein
VNLNIFVILISTSPSFNTAVERRSHDLDTSFRTASAECKRPPADLRHKLGIAQYRPIQAGTTTELPRSGQLQRSGRYVSGSDLGKQPPGEPCLTAEASGNSRECLVISLLGRKLRVELLSPELSAMQNAAGSSS